MARSSTLLALLLPWLVAAIPATPPAPIALTPEERAELQAGKIVVRMDDGSETGGGAIGIVDVAADPERAWSALMDLEARVNEIGGLKKVTYYVKREEEVAARWELKVLTVGVDFHVRYHLDRPNGWVRYSLDPQGNTYQVLVTRDNQRIGRLVVELSDPS